MPTIRRQTAWRYFSYGLPCASPHEWQPLPFSRPHSCIRGTAVSSGILSMVLAFSALRNFRSGRVRWLATAVRSGRRSPHHPPPEIHQRRRLRTVSNDGITSRPTANETLPSRTEAAFCACEDGQGLILGVHDVRMAWFLVRGVDVWSGYVRAATPLDRLATVEQRTPKARVHRNAQGFAAPRQVSPQPFGKARHQTAHSTFARVQDQL